MTRFDLKHHVFDKPVQTAEVSLLVQQWPFLALLGSSPEKHFGFLWVNPEDFYKDRTLGYSILLP